VTGDRDLDGTLSALGAPEEPPPVGDELEARLKEVRPARMRSPARDLALLAAASLLYAAGLVAVLSLRADLPHLPRPWLAIYLVAWLGGFLGLAALALLPPRGQVMPRWRRAGIAGAAACVVFTTGGLLFARHAPGVSTMYEPTFEAVLRHGHVCLRLGLVAAVVPVALAALALRGAMPVRSRWLGAAIGAAGGSLGGLVLHLYCPIAERFHLGLVHGGVVVLGALLCALLLPRVLRP
jgi:hypothetical protein